MSLQNILMGIHVPCILKSSTRKRDWNVIPSLTLTLSLRCGPCSLGTTRTTLGACWTSTDSFVGVYRAQNTGVGGTQIGSRWTVHFDKDLTKNWWLDKSVDNEFLLVWERERGLVFLHQSTFILLIYNDNTFLLILKSVKHYQLSMQLQPK